jgi:hypothetical protein
MIRPELIDATPSTNRAHPRPERLSAILRISFAALLVTALGSRNVRAQEGVPVAPPSLIVAAPPSIKPAVPPASAPATATPAPATTAAAPTPTSPAPATPPPTISAAAVVPAAAPAPAKPAAVTPAAAPAEPAPAESGPSWPDSVAWSGPARSLEAAFRLGVSVATIQVDGTGATGVLLGGSLAYRQGYFVVGALFDSDPSFDQGGSTGAETRSGWHLGAFAGPSLPLSSNVRIDLAGEIGMHQLSDDINLPSSLYSTSATLPYFGVRPSVSVQFGSGRYSGAVGAALFWRVDVGQKQPNGLPDDGGHQLGAELFVALRVGLLSGK